MSIGQITGGLAALLSPDDPLFHFAFESAQFLRAVQNSDLHIDLPPLARLDMLQRLVFAVPGAAEHRAVARFDTSDIGAFVEVLPLLLLKIL